ncbi:fungal-specific transcription factor domain-containing protein [Epithele typhae]|uniref:fungal-specific transcription factor domain-containing protein n=1 Tax=Epithele typhae TaxID=378194 RepID=UPI002007E9E6|nr:fungal-specific transcription factor domain-containing protein [Epithele typhae]KAH9913695.1 fungal-specific transcription factor domain-containing protein [Epithele typhae]
MRPRRRRIKCDEGHPCQSCLTSNSACTFEEPGKRTHPHKSKRAATLEDRMQHLETLIQAIPPQVFAGAGALGAGMPQSPVDPSTNPHASFASSTHIFPTSLPPPSLTAYPLTNPSTFFGPVRQGSRNASPASNGFHSVPQSNATDQLADETARMSLASSYLYFDDEGYTRWQGETSGLPILDLLVERHTVAPKPDPDHMPMPQQQGQGQWKAQNGGSLQDWFPDRQPRRTEANPEHIWKLITSFIVPELMDSLVQCYLSTSYYLLPFLHVPTFLADYGNPRKWGEPGFAAFIVAICCLSSRHIDDPRVRADPNDSNSAGTQWFDLLTRLRTLPGADKPTLYTIQSVLIAGVYAVGLGRLSKAFALLAEAVTLSMDAGLHRSADDYDLFDPVEDEVRKRTFWCVYLWDKQACAHFGRPPVLRLRDCDVGELTVVDDEFVSRDGVGVQPPETESRMAAFVACVRLFVVLESVLDVPPSRSAADTSPFLARATAVLGDGRRRGRELRDEEALLDEICRAVPAHWAHSVETMTSGDVIRVTQAERLHCVEHYIRMLINRHRFSELVAERMQNHVPDGEQGETEVEAMRAAHASALQIISSHLQIAAKGLMTYYGVHVIHQLTAAGRTLVAMLLNCHSDTLRPLIPPALEALRSCVGLLRRFSGRYICGQRSGDLMEEFCRITQIPLETMPRQPQDGTAPTNRPPWVRPVRKKTSSTARSPAGSGDSPLGHGSPDDLAQQASTPTPASAFADPLGSPGAQAQAFAQTFGGGPAFPLDSALGLAMGLGAGAGVGVGGGQVGGGQDPAGAMFAADLMAFLNADPSGLDMGALLASPDGRVGPGMEHPGGFYHLGGTPAGNGGPLSP